MTIRLNKEIKRQGIQSTRKYLLDEMEVDVGDLQTELLLDHVLALFGPVIYNRAVADTQAWLQEKLLDLDGEVFEVEPPIEK